jgi:hypothetical protein
MYASIGSHSNTMIFSDKPGDINALIAQATSVVGRALNIQSSQNSNTTNDVVASNQSNEFNKS